MFHQVSAIVAICFEFFGWSLFLSIFQRHFCTPFVFLNMLAHGVVFSCAVFQHVSAIVACFREGSASAEEKFLVFWSKGWPKSAMQVSRQV